MQHFIWESLFVKYLFMGIQNERVKIYKYSDMRAVRNFLHPMTNVNTMT